jgi:phosphate uptake regulator
MDGLARLGGRVREMLGAAVESWRALDRERARLVRASQEIVARDYQTLFRQLGDLKAESSDGANTLSLVLIAKYLDRVGRHAVSVAEQAADVAPQH